MKGKDLMTRDPITLAGILTERDLLRALAAFRPALDIARDLEDFLW